MRFMRWQDVQEVHPRVANRILKRVRDFAQVSGKSHIDFETAQRSLAALGVDALGLEKLDREILDAIITRFNGGPVGIDQLLHRLVRRELPSRTPTSHI